MLKELIDLDHQITVLTNGQINEKKISKNLYLIKKKPLFYFSNTPIRIRLLYDLVSLLRNDNYDFILAFYPVPYYADLAALVSKLYNIPFYLSYNTFDIQREKKIINFVTFIHKHFIENLTLTRARKIFINSKYLATAKILPSFAEKLAFVATGVDKEMFKPSKESKDSYVLYVGPLNKGQYWKGIDYLLKAIKIVQQKDPQVKLKIVGSGNRKRYYQNMAKSLKVEKCVDFLGFKSGQDLVFLYQNCRFLILPSYDLGELVPTVITEAFACGKTVISTKTAGIPYLVSDGIDGVLVEPKDENSLAQAVLNLWQDKNLRERLSHNAYKKAQNFSWSKMAEEILEAVNNYVDKQ